MARFRLLLLALAAFVWTGCKRSSAPESETKSLPTGESPVASENVGKVTALKRTLGIAPAEIWKEFSGDKAFAEVRKQVELGPRPAASPALEKARVLIEESLGRSGWEVERQTFTSDTPRGPTLFTNLIARFAATGARPAPRDTQRAIVCSHYDTRRFSTIIFLGANDGASSTGALLELARVLALDPELAAKVELVFFDGEEAFVQFTEADGLYGSRHYASQLRAANRHTQYLFGILWDMIGDRDLKLTIPSDSPASLLRELLAAADALKVRQHFGFFDRPIVDDHEPLNRIARIPTIDLIDLDYLYWHTADDTLDRLAPESLQTIGAVTLYHLRKALSK